MNLPILISTPEDLISFCDQLFRNGFLQESSLAEMLTDYLQTPALGFKYGLGAMSFNNAPEFENWGHGGSLIYQSTALHFPQKDVSIAVQQNDPRLNQTDAPVIDINVVIDGLLNACDNYSISVATSEPSTNKLQLSPNLVRLSPNPASNFISIELSEQNSYPIQGFLTNVNGQVVKLFNLAEAKSTLSVDDIPSGIYILRVDQQYEKLLLNKN